MCCEFREYWVHCPRHPRSENGWVLIDSEEEEEHYLVNMGFYDRNKTPTLRYTKSNIPHALKWRVWERDNFTCLKCGSRSKLQVDHIYPEVLGGELKEENLQTLCQSCNRSKGRKFVNYRQGEEMEIRNERHLNGKGMDVELGRGRPGA